MATSPNRTRALIAVLAAAVIGLSVALYLVTRPRPEPQPEPDVATGEREPAPSSDRGSAFAQARQPGLAPAGPPARAFNDLGQPLDENGRPIGPPHKVQRLRNRPIAEGELPMTPPRFDDPAQRAQFKKWWVDEFARRVAIFENIEPGRRDYPSPERTAELLDELYDSSEPRGPDESVEQAIERRRHGRDIARRFLDIYGVPPYTIVTRGGDPQHGKPTPPPFQPPGADTEPGPPAEPATEAPPGRDPAAPGGTDPLDSAGEGRGAETRDTSGRR